MVFRYNYALMLNLEYPEFVERQKLCKFSYLKHKTFPTLRALFKDNIRRIRTISLLLTYLIFSAGVVVGNQICGGQFKEVSFFAQPRNCCPDANSENSC